MKIKKYHDLARRLLYIYSETQDMFHVEHREKKEGNMQIKTYEQAAAAAQLCGSLERAALAIAAIRRTQKAARAAKTIDDIKALLDGATDEAALCGQASPGQSG